jgi:hypothetical protein
VVLRVGNDAGVALTAAAAGVTIEERSLADGALLSSVDVSAQAPSGFSLAGSSTTEGTLNRSTDGMFLVLAGYQAAVGTPSVNSSPQIPRCVARLGASAGTLDVSTVIRDAYLGGSIRAAASRDGTGYWVVGSGSDAGVRYVVHNSNGTSAPVFGEIQNNRSIGIFNGNLIVSTSGTTGLPDGGTQVYSLAGLPQTGPVPYATLPGVEVVGPHGFALIDLSPATMTNKVLYVADPAATTATGGLRKYTFNGTLWTLNWRTFTYTSGGATANAACQYVAALPIANDVAVLCTDPAGARIIRYLDVGGAMSTPPVGVQLVERSNTSSAFRGVAAKPQ